MKEQGILFSAPMVNAILRDEKTQTRRIARSRRRVSILAVEEDGAQEWADSFITDPANRDWLLEEALARPGATLWVRENFRLPAQFDGNRPSNVKTNVTIHFEANGQPRKGGAPFGKLRPSIHLPRERARITLVMADVRVERLWSITEADALAEGITHQRVIVGASCASGRHVEEEADRYFYDGCHEDGFETAVDAYCALWEHVNGAGSWEVDPLVWVYTFARV